MISALPPVSIGLPFFNAEEFLLDSIKSVFAQTHQDWELILMDDGSTDRSLEIARSIDDPRVRVFSDGENRKLAARLNEITALAKYNFIARMDADDLMSTTRIAQQLTLLISRPDIDLISAGVCSLSDECEPVGVRRVTAGHSVTAESLLLGRAGIVHGCILGRKQWFVRNPYREDLSKSQDTNLWVRSYANDDLKILIIPEPLYYYREDGNVTPQKLLLAYRIGRLTVREDARGPRFSPALQARALLNSYVKSGAVRVLRRMGKMSLIRGRRNHHEVSEADKSAIIAEIAAVRATAVPHVRTRKADFP